MSEKSENATNTDYFVFVIEENRQGNRMTIV